MITLDGSPHCDGFRMPGEFEKHQSSWMLWPERTDIWPQGAKPAQRSFVEVATAISRFEELSVGVSAAQFENARFHLPAAVRVIELSYDGCWIRDTGPTFVVNNVGKLRGVDWDFNAWGGLEGGAYFPWAKDNQIAQKILELERADRYVGGMVLEGGAIHVDGMGTLITTEECMLNRNRNPRLSREEIEMRLRAFLSVEQIIWLPRGLYLDEAGGHIDNICAFVRPGELVLNWTNDRKDPNYEILNEAYEVLARSKDAQGRTFTLHKIEGPKPMFIRHDEAESIDNVASTAPRRAGDSLPASYLNFYVVNGGVIVPQFDDPNDKAAIEKLSELFPERQVVGVQSRDILIGGGNVHCIVLQIPSLEINY